MPGVELRFVVATDIVDSTRLSAEPAVASKLWADHDRMARDLIRAYRGRELGRTDGIVALFESADDAIAFAGAYHQALGTLTPPMAARVGVHGGEVGLRRNLEGDVALGAIPLEIDGTVLPISVRLQSLALGGQTLASRQVLALASVDGASVSHGFWRLKGVADPIEVCETLGAAQIARRPSDVEKAFQVEHTPAGWIPAQAARARLPNMAGRFVGRAAEIAEIARRVEGDAAVTTLLGIGGAGKTRLAVQFARFGPVYFEGGVWFCDLTPSTDLDGALLAFSGALDVPLVTSSAESTLAHALASRGRSLVIVNNAEGAAKAVAALLADLSIRSPLTRFIVTSRIALQVPGESVVPIGPLAPADAVELFESRAASAGAVLVESERAALQSLVNQLDRLPLALELAACRAPSLSPTQQLERMDSWPCWLRMPPGSTMPARQETLAAVFAASWQTLSDTERSVLSQLTVFDGGFNLASAEAVVDAGEEWVGDVLAGLVLKSLLPPATESRQSMLRTVRDQVIAQCGTDREALRLTGSKTRHARHFSAYKERLVVARNFVDLENLVSATEYARLLSDGETAIRLLTLCAEVLMVRGPIGRLLTMADALRAMPSLRPGDRAEVLRVQGNALLQLGRRDEALGAFEEGLALARQDGDSDRQIRLSCALAAPWARSGRAEDAQVLLNEIQPAAEMMGDPVRLCTLSNTRGAIELAQQRPELAIDSFDAALGLARSAGHRRWEGGVRGNLGMAMYMCGRLEEARSEFEASLDIAREIGDRAWTANALCNLGLVRMEAGLNVAAGEALAEALQIAREIGQATLEATTGCNLGLLLLQDGRPREAVSPLRAASVLAARLADYSLQAQCERALGKSLAAINDESGALAALERAAEAAQSADDLGEQARCHLQRAQLFHARGDDTRRAAEMDRARSLAAQVPTERQSALFNEIDGNCSDPVSSPR